MRAACDWKAHPFIAMIEPLTWHGTTISLYRLYRDLAHWWPLLSPAEEYLDEANFFIQLFDERHLPINASLLEFGAGGGHNACHMKSRFSKVVLTDQSEAMLAVSRTLNPDCEHRKGDMRTLALGCTFDAVFVHDAIDYMCTRQDLASLLRNVARHCRPGGWALLAPDHMAETFVPATEHGGSDAEDRSIRYLEWSHDPNPEDEMITVDYVYVMREQGAPPSIIHESHHCGLFSRKVWSDELRSAGFLPETLVDPFGREIFIARRG
ncbi:MAG: class I SAM-dependent methyltransferase [Pseudomonadales bacterium]